MIEVPASTSPDPPQGNANNVVPMQTRSRQVDSKYLLMAAAEMKQERDQQQFSQAEIKTGVADSVWDRETSKQIPDGAPKYSTSEAEKLGEDTGPGALNIGKVDRDDPRLLYKGTPGKYPRSYGDYYDNLVHQKGLSPEAAAREMQRDIQMRSPGTQFKRRWQEAPQS